MDSKIGMGNIDPAFELNLALRILSTPQGLCFFRFYFERHFRGFPVSCGRTSADLTQLAKPWPHRREVKLSILQVM